MAATQRGKGGGGKGKGQQRWGKKGGPDGGWSSGWWAGQDAWWATGEAPKAEDAAATAQALLEMLKPGTTAGKAPRQPKAPKRYVPAGEVPQLGPDEAGATAQALLDLLKSGAPPAGKAPRQPPRAVPKVYGKPPWLVAETRPAVETPSGIMPPDQLLGHWVDSQGNSVHVFSTDAFDVKLVATLTKPPRPDIHLTMKPVLLGAGWQCGHSVLDPMWSSAAQLHWVAMDGRVSVWVRLQPQDDKDSQEQKAEVRASALKEAEKAKAENEGAQAQTEAKGAADAKADGEPRSSGDSGAQAR